jgi:hypothetical protein
MPAKVLIIPQTKTEKQPQFLARSFGLTPSTVLTFAPKSISNSSPMPEFLPVHALWLYNSHNARISAARFLFSLESTL